MVMLTTDGRISHKGTKYTKQISFVRFVSLWETFYAIAK
jgi:hypothetical protein